MALPALRRKRRREPAPEPQPRQWTWQPVTGEVIEGNRGMVEDDTCAGIAYGVYYQIPDGPPTAILTVWTYPVYLGSADGFIIGHAWEHTVYQNGEPPDRWFTWSAVDGNDFVYADLDEAYSAAQSVAGSLSRSGYTGTFPGAGVTGFDWDGTP